MLPVDLVVARFARQPDEDRDIDVGERLTAGQKAFDIGPHTSARYDAALSNAKTIFWNGPMGVFEKEEFAKGTMAMAARRRRSRRRHGRRRRRVGRGGEGLRLRRSHHPHFDGRRRVAGVHLGRDAAGRGGPARRRRRVQTRSYASK